MNQLELTALKSHSQHSKPDFLLLIKNRWQKDSHLTTSLSPVTFTDVHCGNSSLHFSQRGHVAGSSFFLKKKKVFAGQHRLAVRERGKISNSNSRNGNPSNEPCCFQKSTELFKVTSSLWNWPFGFSIATFKQRLGIIQYYANFITWCNSASFSLALQETTETTEIACQYATFSPYQPPALID